MGTKVCKVPQILSFSSKICEFRGYLTPPTAILTTPMMAGANPAKYLKQFRVEVIPAARERDIIFKLPEWITQLVGSKCEFSHRKIEICRVNPPILSCRAKESVLSLTQSPVR